MLDEYLKQKRIEEHRIRIRRERKDMVIATLVLIAAAVVAAFLFYASRAHAAPPIVDLEAPPTETVALDDPSVAPKIEEAMIWLVTKRGANEKHPILSDPVYRANIRVAAVESGEKYDVPADLLLAMAYRETVYKMDTVGKRGELGLMQVGSLGRRHCAKACGAMVTASEQMDCGACWFDHGRKWCGGDIRLGLNVYASGPPCKASAPATIRATFWRYRVWRKIHEMVYGVALTS
ncbi:MAG: hypothetical protein PHX83_06715 [Acidobacteriia bacterium]|nr:hypothetical protein [Terriglobia bacterium]